MYDDSYLFRFVITNQNLTYFLHVQKSFIFDKYLKFEVIFATYYYSSIGILNIQSSESQVGILMLKQY